MRIFWLLAAAALTAGCPRAHENASNTSGDGGSGSGGETVNETANPENRCVFASDFVPIDSQRVEALDLLFVIDNSGSMKEEQVKLRAELSRMIEILISGDMNPENGITLNADFSRVKDLHLAVVSTDMGLPGLRFSPDPEPICSGFGDDGKFLRQSNPAQDPDLTCPFGGYPAVLTFKEGDDVDEIANDLQCLSALGIGGCGFEMQLEAPLKGLWPADPENLSEQQAAMNIVFLYDTPSHGDQYHAEFLRGTAYHPSQSDQLSILAIILVTDEEDCSAGAQGNVDFLLGGENAPPGVASQPPHLRCHFDTENKYPVRRYIDAFKALRPGYEKLVVFAAIAGIPPDINAQAFDQDGEPGLSSRERDAYYDGLLDHRLMQERIRSDGQNLEPVCTIDNPDHDPDDPSSEQFLTSALPARRITEVARGFGANGVVQSICQENFTEAMNSIIKAISRLTGGTCLPPEF